MARKTKEDTQATREGILDAAEACFHEHGVARTTLEMIGARAGYTRGAVYWHFKNKSEVLAAIVERVHLPFMQELERTSTDQRDTPVHDLRAVMIHSFIELSEDERLRKTMEIMLRSDASADTRVLTEMQQAGFRDALDRMERALRLRAIWASCAKAPTPRSPRACCMPPCWACCTGRWSNRT